MIPWTIARQAPLSTGFPRQEYWSGSPFPSPGDLLDPGIESTSLVFAGRVSTPELPGKPEIQDSHIQNHTAAKSLQSCLTLCDPTDGSPPGSSVPGILQAGIPEWVAVSFSNAWKWKVKVKLLSRVWLLATPWTVAYQAPLSMGFSRQEYWSGLPFPSPQTTGNSQ